MNSDALEEYLAECRQLTLGEISAIVPRGGRYQEILYDRMRDYPLRASKALRPALCMAACRAFGGRLESVLRSAAVLELYHNAFLIHDDVEDGSEQRRDRPTLHWTHGMPIAVNVGDAMLALALQPLLDNMALLGLGKALRVLQIVARMARESAEGQALELEWIRLREWNQSDADYIRMVYKKTSWYTFVAPVLIGAAVAGCDAATQATLRKFAALLGIAFQIQDDILNLVNEGSAYGKEVAGDLWEAKHTLIVLHMMRHLAPAERARAQLLLAKPRPGSQPSSDEALRPRLAELARELEESRALTAAGRAAIESLLGSASSAAKTDADVEELLQRISATESIAYARNVAHTFARRAGEMLSRVAPATSSSHREFLGALVDFVIERTH